MIWALCESFDAYRKCVVFFFFLIIFRRKATEHFFFSHRDFAKAFLILSWQLLKVFCCSEKFTNTLRCGWLYYCSSAQCLLYLITKD
jgi:hypothetical protein